jgi:vacuolar-type H+-ATPase subunit F/Vma7
MKAPVNVICRHETAIGVALAGLAPIEVSSGSEAAEALTALGATPSKGGVVFLEDSLYAVLPNAVRRQIRRDGAPILMPFPGPPRIGFLASPEAELLDILRRAVGYRVRLR